jgi:hypothetical protein
MQGEAITYCNRITPVWLREIAKMLRWNRGLKKGCRRIRKYRSTLESLLLWEVAFFSLLRSGEVLCFVILRPLMGPVPIHRLADE